MLGLEVIDETDSEVERLGTRILDCYKLLLLKDRDSLWVLMLALWLGVSCTLIFYCLTTTNSLPNALNSSNTGMAASHHKIIDRLLRPQGELIKKRWSLLNNNAKTAGPP